MYVLKVLAVASFLLNTVFNAANKLEKESTSLAVLYCKLVLGVLALIAQTGLYVMILLG